jgi:hypothetical protein
MIFCGSLYGCGQAPYGLFAQIALAEGYRHFPTPSTSPHLPGKIGISLQPGSVETARCYDESTASPELLIADLQDAQVRPGLWADTQDRVKDAFT